MSFGFIILTALSIGLSVAQSYLQKKAADKARRKSFRGVDIRQSFSDQEIPRLYGRTAQEGITVFAETRGNFQTGSVRTDVRRPAHPQQIQTQRIPVAAASHFIRRVRCYSQHPG